MNLRPADRPRRHTTWHLCPVRGSRENASRNVPGRFAASSSQIFGPEVEMSCTTHWRAAKPPSSVIHADCPNSLRASRFLAAGMFIPPKHQTYPGAALESVDWNAEAVFPARAEKHCRFGQTPLYVRPPLACGAINPSLSHGQILASRC